MIEQRLMIHPYTREGVRLEWEPEGTIAFFQTEPAVIRGNRAGLVTLARHLLTLAQSEVPVGAHIHLDQFNGLEDESSELVLELGA
jgi:hypothetical protein